MTFRSSVDRCPTCKRKRTRSSEANRRYWLLLHVISDKIKPQEQTYSADTWHVYMKQRYLGCVDTLMPNDKTVSVPRTTTELDTQEFNEYMLKVELWAGEHGCYLEDMAEA